MSNISKIKISGTSYDIKDENACKVVELTQAQYDALPASAKTSNSLFVITDAQGGDLSNYYTKSETSGATEISTALNAKQTTLTAGTGISIVDNVISATGGGGGGKSIEAGRGISIATGETADTVSFSLPISAGTGINSIRVANTNNTASGSRSFAGGEGCVADGTDAFAFGVANTASSTSATAFGFKTKTDVYSSFVCGKWNDIANANTGENFGNSGNTLFAVGNGWKQNDWTSGTANKHNAFEIRQNGDIYIADTNDTTYQNFYEKPMIKLQDALGGGGSSYSAGTGIDITNDVISVTGKVDTSAITTSVTSSSTDSQVPSAKAVNDKLGGLSIVKMSQSEYDNLATKDNSTLYVIVN